MRSDHKKGTKSNTKIKYLLFACEPVVDHKYKALLQNIQTKHIITEIASPDQIIKMRKLGITNYFVLGSLESIENVLGKTLN